MSQKRAYNVFFAIPFDAATKSMYETIIEDLRAKFKDDFHFSLGTTSVDNTKPDFSKIEQLKIEEFKAQNQDFLTRFVHVIESSDIIIADLTNNNPSVHIELGIALTLNKNIMRVSGRNLISTATDLQGYEVNQYTCRQQLTDWIKSYLTRFLTIKRTDPTLVIPGWHDLTPAVIAEDIARSDRASAKRKLAETVHTWALTPPINGRTRDSEISVHFKFIETSADDDWFGILLRNDRGNPWLGTGSFVYARLDGRLEIHNIPHQELIFRMKKYKPLDKEREYVLRVNIDGNHVSASLDEELEGGAQYDTEGYQSPGDAYIICYRSFVEFGNVEFALHDAIAFR